MVRRTEPDNARDEGAHMADKSPKKDASKKAASSSLKEKRAEKKAKASETSSKARKS
jgi:hypothetical protein